MPTLPIPPDERARHLTVLRRAVAHQAHALATLLAGLGDIYVQHPEERGLIAYVGGHAERVRHDLVGAERHIAPAGV